MKSFHTMNLQGVVPSLPSRERGLKYPMGHLDPGEVIVAPLAGAWIEMTMMLFLVTRLDRKSVV